MGLIGGIGLIVCALVMARATAAAARGDLARNAGMGIRTRATQSSDDAWVRGHGAALVVVRPLAVVSVLLGLVLLGLGVAGDPQPFTTVAWVVGFVVLGAGLLVATVRANAEASRTP